MHILEELELFLILTETGSFTAAAQRLGVPRATLSRRLSRYEQSLGVTLLERSTRALRLTEAGRLLLARGAPIFQDAERLAEEVQQVDEEPRGPLVLAAQTGLGRGFSDLFIDRLRSGCPFLELRLVSSPHPLMDALEVADVILTEGPLQDLDWVAVGLGPSDRIAVASPEYLRRRGHPEDVAALEHHDLLSVAEEPRRALRWPLRAGGEIGVRPVIASDDLDTVLQCALRGLGVALLPLMIAAIPLAEGRLEMVLPEALGREARFYVLYPQHRRGSPKIQGFMRCLEAFIEEMGSALTQSMGTRPLNWGRS